MANFSTEKRKYKRYNVTDFVVAVFGNRLGQILNISENGIAVQLLDDDFKLLPEKCRTFFISKDKGIMIEDLPLKLVRKEVVAPPFLSTVAAKFDTSDTDQLGKIKKYISGFC
jgi:hypothetical protein